VFTVVLDSCSVVSLLSDVLLLVPAVLRNVLPETVQSCLRRILKQEPDPKVVSIMKDYFKGSVRDAFCYDNPAEGLLEIYEKAQVPSTAS
jgi:hypothetical protein